MSLPQLSPDDQRDLRDAASDAWKQSGGEYLRAAAIFKQDSRIAKFDALTVITLMMWWRAHKVSEPPIIELSGEPAFGGAE